MSREIDESKLGRIYAMIYWYISNNGISPSIKELKEFIKFKSTGRVEHYLGVMQTRGWITFATGTHRSITLLNHKKLAEFTDEIDDIEIAELTTGFSHVEGTIAAGLPIDHSFFVPRRTLHARNLIDTRNLTYRLKVKGQSMVNDHICDGDYVLIRRQSTCENGDIIVASHLLSDSTSSSTLKHFFKDKEENLIILRSSIDPIEIPGDKWDNEWEIQGKLIEVLRWFGN